MSDQDLKNMLLLLLEHPQEPVFVPKGPEGLVFHVSVKYLSEEYKSLGSDLIKHYTLGAKSVMHLGEIRRLEQYKTHFEKISQLKRRDHFSLFLDKHVEIAGHLIDIFMEAKDIGDLLCIGAYARDNFNPYLFNYAFSVALLHRQDTNDVILPSLVRIFPDKFVESKFFVQAREQAKIVPAGMRKPIVINPQQTATERDEEQRLAYFREDLAVNLHHWHWHLVYPAGGATVSKDRRGELFYYMHEQIVARYNFERLCNRLKPVERLNDFAQSIKEAYYPKLHNAVTGKPYGSRANDQKLQDVDRVKDEMRQDVKDLEAWNNRIQEAVHRGRLINEKGQIVKLSEDGSIDILGNLVEATTLSMNRKLYGNLHNTGHNFIAFIHDPQGKYLEDGGVMGDTATAMRDPTFYRWHAYINDIFQKHKVLLPPYEVDRLDYPGISVTKVEVQSAGSAPNILNTFWEESEVDVSKGLDFLADGGPVVIRFTHLQHRRFVYHITVNNVNPGVKLGTCRIFLSPKFDEIGNPWPRLQEQRLMFIELDKFTVTLKYGINNITRLSEDSSVTIPFEQSFSEGKFSGGISGSFCGCGWPQHLLIPKGNPEGEVCQLFVMISNYDDDKVQQDFGKPMWMAGDKDTGSYCGLRDKKYPDRRSMGYPFDRPPKPLPKNEIVTLDKFLTPNMRVEDVTIVFEKPLKPRIFAPIKDETDEFCLVDTVTV